MDSSVASYKDALKAFRKAIGASQKQVADAADLSNQQHVNRIENEDALPRPRTAHSIHSALAKLAEQGDTWVSDTLAKIAELDGLYRAAAAKRSASTQDSGTEGALCAAGEG